jgi:hypothetical protein
MKKLLLLLTLILYGCTNDTCICTETITNIRSNSVYVREYLIECDNPYIVLETYEWGNIVTDCR